MASKFRSTTPWRDKLTKDQPARIVFVPPGKRGMACHGQVLIPKPIDVDAQIRKVRRGRLVTIAQLRERLARDYGADDTCPMCTGIFIRITAEAAEEDRRAGRKRITPWWRVVREDGSLNVKLPGGGRTQRSRLREEGHSFEPARGSKPPRVVDVQASLTRL